MVDKDRHLLQKPLCECQILFIPEIFEFFSSVAPCCSLLTTILSSITLQDRLRSNENYRQISHLEEKLTDLITENKVLEESLSQMKKVRRVISDFFSFAKSNHILQEFDYSELKRQAEENLDTLLNAIRNDNLGF